MAESLEKLSKEELISEVLRQKNHLTEKEIKLSEYESELLRLQQQLSFLQKQIFGQKKETYKSIDNPEQTKLFDENQDLDLPSDQELMQVNYQRKKANKKREDYSKLELPSDLPREEVVIEPEGLTSDMERIGEEVTEVLAISPQRFYVKRIVRPKYAKANKEGVVVAELPTRTIAGGKVDESLLTFILLYKYVYHLPLYRQVKMFANSGMKLSDSTLGDWVAKTVDQLDILYQRLVHRIRGSNYLQVDETTMKVLDKDKKNKAHLGWYWVYHSVEDHLCVFDYHPSRGQQSPTLFLQDYTGILQTDGYGAYDALASGKESIVLAGCMAHARRKFFDAQQNHKELACRMLDMIQELYEIEKESREANHSPEERLQLRKTKAVPILGLMKSFLDEHIVKVVPKSTLGGAIAYMRSRWNKLTLYTTDGRLEIDNNKIENAIRPVALGRKNYLFAGSHPAAQRGAIVYSLFACCKINDLDPMKWMEDVLRKLPETKTSELDLLLPTKNYSFS